MKEKFSVVYAHRSIKDLNKNKFRQDKEKIKRRISMLRYNPFVPSQKTHIKKIVSSKYIYRLKFYISAGSLRCVYQVYKREQKCVVLEIDFRENINYQKYTN